jgi:hypothetical protein
LFSFTLARAKDDLKRKREGTGEEEYKMYIYIYIKVSILQDSLCHRRGVIKFVREKGKKSSR